MKNQFLTIIILALIFCFSSAQSQTVEYEGTVGQLKTNMALSSNSFFGKYAFFEQGEQAIALSGAAALNWLAENGYGPGITSGDELSRLKELLTQPGAIAILLPNWAPASQVTNGGETILYIPYPTEASVRYGLQPITGHFVVPTVNGCEPCQCFSGKTPNTAFCYCAGMSACCPCPGGSGFCSSCDEVRPSKIDMVQELCERFPGCSQGGFEDPRPIAELPLGTQF